MRLVHNLAAFLQLLYHRGVSAGSWIHFLISFIKDKQKFIRKFTLLDEILIVSRCSMYEGQVFSLLQ